MTTPNPGPGPVSEASSSLDALARDVADAALLRGTFTLRSGRTSSYYLDKYRFSTRPDLLRRIGAALAALVIDEEAATGVRFDRLAGAELGGVPLVTALGLALDRPTLLVRAGKKDYGTAKRIEGVFEPGERAVFIEDVTTSGGQAIEAVGVLREAGLIVPCVITTIDREEGARAAIEAGDVRFRALLRRAMLGIDES